MYKFLPFWVSGTPIIGLFSKIADEEYKAPEAPRKHLPEASNCSFRFEIRQEDLT